MLCNALAKHQIELPGQPGKWCLMNDGCVVDVITAISGHGNPFGRLSCLYLAFPSALGEMLETFGGMEDRRRYCPLSPNKSCPVAPRVRAESCHMRPFDSPTWLGLGAGGTALGPVCSVTDEQAGASGRLLTSVCLVL